MVKRVSFRLARHSRPDCRLAAGRSTSMWRKLQHRHHRAIATADFTSSFVEGDKKVLYETRQAVGNIWWYQPLPYVWNILLPARC
jgi:hypothetical protein